MEQILPLLCALLGVLFLSTRMRTYAAVVALVGIVWILFLLQQQQRHHGHGNWRWRHHRRPRRQSWQLAAVDDDSSDSDSDEAVNQGTPLAHPANHHRVLRRRGSGQQNGGGGPGAGPGRRYGPTTAGRQRGRGRRPTAQRRGRSPTNAAPPTRRRRGTAEPGGGLAVRGGVHGDAHGDGAPPTVHATTGRRGAPDGDRGGVAEPTGAGPRATARGVADQRCGGQRVVVAHKKDGGTHTPLWDPWGATG